MKRWFWILAALFVLAGVMQGCSGSKEESASTMISGSSQSPGMNGSQSQPASSGSPSVQMVKPGQLVSQVEAASLLGEAVKDGVSGGNPLLNVSICFYAAENTASTNYLQIVLIPQNAGESGGGPGESSQPSESAPNESGESSQPSESGGKSEGMSPKSLYEALKMMFSDPNTPVTGRLGDDAFISTQGTGILYREYFIYIAAGGATPEAAQAIVKQAGELAVENLRRILGE
jgi:hypothetical protein